MIKLADTTIMLAGSEGHVSVFDPDRLQSRLIQSFLAAGIDEVQLADDISLAVEFSLRKSKRKDKVFSLSEVNSSVVRILQDTGFPEVAAIYARRNACTRMTIDPEFNTVKELLQKHLGVVESLDLLCGKVISAVRQLNIEDAAPELFIELAKHYETAEFSEEDIEPVSLVAWEHDNHWLVSAKSLEQELATSTRGLLAAGVIRLVGVSSLFPSVRIFFMINEFCRFHGLEAPLTEMMLAPYLFAAGKAVDNCIQVTAAMAEESGDNELPVFLNIPDMSSFAVKMLEASWPEAEKDCREMLSPLYNSLSRKLFKLKLS